MAPNLPQEVVVGCLTPHSGLGRNLGGVETQVLSVCIDRRYTLPINVGAFYNRLKEVFCFGFFVFVALFQIFNMDALSSFDEPMSCLR